MEPAPTRNITDSTPLTNWCLWSTYSLDLCSFFYFRKEAARHRAVSQHGWDSTFEGLSQVYGRLSGAGPVRLLAQ